MRKWQIIRTPKLVRHTHRTPYAAVVLSGSYEEAGDLGRFHVLAGDVVLHDSFEAHLDRVSAPTVTILNISLAANCCAFQPGVASTSDPDAIVRAAERDESEAAALLLSSIEMQQRRCRDWPDELASTLLQDPSLRLSQWCETRGIPAWTLSRGFSQVFGISPASFRTRVRARLAWMAVRKTEDPLVRIALELGFSDQAHMTRSITGMTGKPPQAWRLPANRFKTP